MEKPQIKLVEIFKGELWRLKIPMEVPTEEGDIIKYSGSVNCYIVRGRENKWIIIDTGFYNETGKQAWKQAISELKLEPDQIEAILLTHFHSDHTGMAGWFETWTGAPAYMHQADIHSYEQEFGDVKRNVNRVMMQLIRYGMEGEFQSQVEKETFLRSRFVKKRTSFVPLSEGEQFLVCEGTLQAFWVPGHTDGQCMYVWKEKNVVFSGDILLPASFAPLGLHHYGQKNPVGTATVELFNLPILLDDGIKILPGHGWQFEHPGIRAKETIKYYLDKAEFYKRKCTEGVDTPWSITLEQLGGREVCGSLRMTMWEGMAYMEYLYYSGQVFRREEKQADRAVFKYVPIPDLPDAAL